VIAAPVNMAELVQARLQHPAARDQLPGNPRSSPSFRWAGSLRFLQALFLAILPPISTPVAAHAAGAVAGRRRQAAPAGRGGGAAVGGAAGSVPPAGK
jgi:hypothetical protein